VDDPDLIRAEIAALQRDIDATLAEIRGRLSPRGRLGAAAGRVRPAAARMVREARTPTPGARTGGEDLLGRTSRAASALRGEPLAAIALAAAGGVLWALLTAGD
jgi:hypothetical protein